MGSPVACLIGVCRLDQDSLWTTTEKDIFLQGSGTSFSRDWETAGMELWELEMGMGMVGMVWNSRGH